LETLIQVLNEYEIEVFLLSSSLSAIFLFTWYERIFNAWPRNRGKSAKFVLGLLPVIAFGIIFPILRTLASHDVVNDPFYIIFYLALGYAWLYFDVVAMSAFFDLSWVDDILNMNNKAALFVFTCGFIGLAVMYAAVNIGDGPGWGCVVFTGALGFIIWIFFALAQNYFAQVFERVTVERDAACAVRFGSFLLGNAIFLSRPLSGDWLSLHMTLVDFVPAFIAVAVELVFVGYEKFRKSKSSSVHNTANSWESNMLWSVIWAIIFLAGSIASITIFK